jgi:hypothetical protein
MRYSAIILFLLLLVWTVPSMVQAQTTTDPDAIFRPSSREAQSGKAETKAAPKKKTSNRNSFDRQLDQKKKEFEKRMKDNAKKYRKMEKEMRKPQYSDPMYFGHKRKPKKRPPGKQKFCKECGMKH